MEDDEGGGFGAIFEALSKKFGTTTAVVILLTVLAMFLLRSNENYGPLMRPLMVGHWESTARLEDNTWIRVPRPIVLTLYDDGVASLDGLKGSWTVADVSRLAVRIELPSRDKVSLGNLYELRVKLGEPLRGTMRVAEAVLRFEQLEQGGAEAQLRKAWEKPSERNGRRGGNLLREHARKRVGEKLLTELTFGYSRRDPWIVAL